VRTFIASLAALCLGASATSVKAEQPLASGGLGAQLCGPDQLSGQYECVTSTPLSAEEVRVSMAYLAALKPLHEAAAETSIDVAAADVADQDRGSRD
jgi:hypothetical protein